MDIIAGLDNLIESAEVVRIPVGSKHEIQSVSRLHPNALKVGHDFPRALADIPCIDQERRPVRPNNKCTIALLDVDLVDG